MTRCFHCNRQLGLGTVSKRVWKRQSFFWEVYRFCSQRCNNTFAQLQQQEREREREALKFYRSQFP